MNGNRGFSSERRELAVKITVLALIIALGGLITVSLPIAVSGSIPKVNTVFPDVRDYTPSVNCTGTIVYGGVKNITADLPVVIERYNVETGQHIDEGQVIASVDRDGTVSALTALYGDRAELASGLTDEEIPDKIIAEISGTVCAVGRSGELIQSGEPIAQVGQKGDLRLAAAVSQRDISKVGIGQRVTITAADGQYSGTVCEISDIARKEYDTPNADTVVDVSVIVDDAGAKLRSGYSAKGTIEIGCSEQILTLPYDAICQDDQGEYVYVFENGNAKRHGISTGVELEECAQVIGLDLSDEVIINAEELSADCLVIRNGIVSKQEGE